MIFIAFAIIIIGVVVILCILLEYKKWKIDKMTVDMVTPKQYPIIGIGHRFIGKDNEAVLREIADMFRNERTPVKAWFGPVFVIGIAEPEDMQVILSSTNCLQKGYFYEFLHNKTGIFSSDVETWKVHRKILNPTFNWKLLHKFTPIFNEKSFIMIEQMNQLAGHNTGIDLYQIIFKCALDITVNTVMSTKMELQNEEGDMIHHAFTGAFQHVAQRMFRVWQRPDCIYQLTNAYKEEMKHFNRGYSLIRRIKQMKIVELEEKLKTGEDILEQERQSNTLTFLHKCFLMWREGTFNETNVDEEMDTIFVGGIDTSSITIVNTIMMLAIHQDVQQKCVDELSEIFVDVREKVTQDHVSKMKYLDMVIMETLRVLPAGPYLARTCVEPLPLKTNIIPKGAVILLLFDKMNRDEQIWGNTANKFDPNRFSPELCDQRHPWSFLPFSGGPRNCIGIKHAKLSVKIILAHLLRNYKFTTHIKCLEDVRFRMDITMKIINKDPVQYVRRQFAVKNIKT